MKFFLFQDQIRKKTLIQLMLLNNIKKEKNLKVKLGIAYNPYLKKYYNISSERERFEKKFLQD